jgi:hypothetical protein
MPEAGIESWIVYPTGFSENEQKNALLKHTVFFGSPITLPLGRRS